MRSAALWILLIAGGYLSGSLLFSYRITRLARGVDLFTAAPDSNPGTANAMHFCGPRLGFLCLALDLCKGFLPVWLAQRQVSAQSPLFALVLLAPVAGHAFSVFHRFRGGKCIAVIFGVLLGALGVSPAALILAVLYILFSLLRVQPHRKRSLLTFALFLPLSAGTELIAGRRSLAAGCALIAAVALFKHLPRHEKALEIEYKKE